MNRCFMKTWVVAAGLLSQQLLVVAVAQEKKPELAVGRVPGPQIASGVLGTPATESQEKEPWDGLGKSGSATTEPGRADGTGKPALGGERRPFYRLAKSDVLEIDFTFSPEFNQTVSIQPDGYLRLRGVGSLYAEGRTLSEFEELVRKQYAVTLHDPEVSVILKDFDKPYFIATGEAGRPGKYELRGDTTVSEAVAIAGGFTHEARHSQVLLFRKVTDDVVEARVLNVKKMLSKGQLTEDAHLRPGDLVFVPQNTVSKVRRYLPVPNVGMYLNGSQF
jgi:polysaccharide export outer membrane protein